jgi:hypothetical protein
VLVEEVAAAVIAIPHLQPRAVLWYQHDVRQILCHRVRYGIPRRPAMAMNSATDGQYDTYD